MTGIFNDHWFERARTHVLNQVTEEEITLFRLGKIRKVYESFEILLLDNLEYYERIIRTIIWLYENILIDNGKTIDRINKEPYQIPMTPTKFYYLILLNVDATLDEIHYAYPTVKYSEEDTFVTLFKKLRKVTAFSFNIVFMNGKRPNLKSYTELLKSDITSKEYLDKVLSNFSKSACFITESELLKDLTDALQLYTSQSELKFNILSDAPEGTMCEINPNKIVLFNQTAEHVCEYIGGNLKQYSVRNFRECFTFSQIFASNLQPLYSWFLTAVKSYDNTIVELMTHFIKSNHRGLNFVRFSDDGILISTIKLKKRWNQYKAIEETRLNGVLIRTNSYYAKLENIGKLLYKKGYFIFGYEDLKFMLSTYSDILTSYNKLFGYWCECIKESQNDFDSFKTEILFAHNKLMNFLKY